MPSVADLPAKPRTSSLRRFILTLLAFWTPLALVFGLAEAALWRSGEYLSCQQVLEAQAHPQSATIWLRGYADQDFARYKWLGFQKKRPKVIALGSSRAMQLRAEMFGRDGASFYNLGGAVRSLADLEAWLNAVTDDLLPKVIILEVDVWWFDERWAGEDLFTEGIQRDHLQWQSHLSAIRGLLLSGRWSFVRRLLVHGHHPDRLGLNAELRNEGFRADGSRQSSRPPPSPDQLRDHLHSINRDWSASLGAGPSMGSRQSKISRERLMLLNRLLTRLQHRGVNVLAFASAFADAYVDAQQQDPRSRLVWSSFGNEVSAVFRTRGIPFLPATRTQDLGLDDRYLRDSHHPNDTFHLYVLRQLLRHPDASRALPTASQAVEAAIASPKTNVWYPDLSVGRRLMKTESRLLEEPP